jgi:glycosyltransferase involved in cell wall biosynthesis
VDTGGLGFSNLRGPVNRLGARLRVALVVSGFPTRDNPRRGVFNMRARQALSSHADVAVVFLRAWVPGRRRWQPSFFEKHEFAIVTAPQLPAVEFARRYSPGARLSQAANIHLFRKFGWGPIRETIISSDIVHSVDGVVGMVVSEWASRAGKRHVTQIIGSDVNTIIPSLPRCAANGWEQHLHGVLCNSRDLASRFSALYPNVANVRTIYRGVDLQAFDSRGGALSPQAHGRQVRFGFFGGFMRQALKPNYVKGGPILLSAWKIAEDKLAETGASLLLAGPACDTNTVTAWRRSLRYPDRVNVVGDVPPAQMAGYLRGIDALIVPSFAEGLPNVCLEALACGRCVLASNVGGIPDVIVHGDNGILIPAGDVTAWADTLIHYSTRINSLQEMGRHGRLRVQQDFDSRRYGPQIVGLYEDALRMPTKRAVAW